MEQHHRTIATDILAYSINLICAMIILALMDYVLLLLKFLLIVATLGLGYFAMIILAQVILNALLAIVLNLFVLIYQTQVSLLDVLITQMVFIVMVLKIIIIRCRATQRLVLTGNASNPLESQLDVLL